MLFRSLGDRARFDRVFRKPIEQDGDGERARLLRARIAPFVLRRTKQQVAPELPPRTEALVPLRGGYDHPFALDDPGDLASPAARLVAPRSGRVLTVHTTQPCLQLYTGNFLDGSIHGKGGVPYRQHAGFCLETQTPPNAVNCPNLPSCILRPGDTYRHIVDYRFGTT